jgi:hypothetical protein
MTNATKLIAGLLLIVITTIEYGGTFLLGILSGSYSGFTEFQRSMFRAGHAHAGVLTILALVALLFTDQAGLSAPTGWAVRIGFAAPRFSWPAGFSARPWATAELNLADSSHFCGRACLCSAAV